MTQALSINHDGINNVLADIKDKRTQRVAVTLIDGLEQHINHMSEQEIFDEIAYVLSLQWVGEQFAKYINEPTLN